VNVAHASKTGTVSVSDDVSDFVKPENTTEARALLEVKTSGSIGSSSLISDSNAGGVLSEHSSSDWVGKP
jgi:hypothetical protein